MAVGPLNVNISTNKTRPLKCLTFDHKCESIIDSCDAKCENGLGGGGACSEN